MNKSPVKKITDVTPIHATERSSLGPSVEKITRRTIDLNPEKLNKMRTRKGNKVVKLKDDTFEENWWPDNTVKTNKYTLLSFLPVNLFGV